MRALRIAGLHAAVLVVYVVAGKFGLSFFGLVHPSASSIWWPTGIAMAAILLAGFRIVPTVFVAAFLVNVTTAGSIPTSLAVALGNTLEGIVAVALVNRFAGGRNAFASAGGVLRFAGLAAMASTAVSATIGVTSLLLGGYAAPADRVEIWFTWWLGDAAGAMLVTPLVVLWWTNRTWRWSRQQVQEAVLLLAALGAVAVATFFHPTLARYPLSFLCLAPLVWGALRFGPRETATAVFVLALIAITATAANRGPFTMTTPNESLLVLQAFLVLTTMTVLPMAALTAERRASLERERAARAEADAASRAKDEFLAILGHELRNPLAAISAAAAVLDDGRQTDAERARLAEAVRRQSRHLARLFDDLLDIGRMTANKLQLRREPLDLGVVVRRAVEALVVARGLPTERIELAIGAVWIDADPVRIVQIVENLVDNALKHTPAGRRIRVTVQESGDIAELRVEDEGLGIRPELLPNVFEPFMQGQQGLDRRTGGLGLGLTLVQRLTELHGGNIEARSEGTDRGSAFILRFPRGEPAAGKPPAATPMRPPTPSRLLIVEDNRDARYALRMLLEALGNEVHEASDGDAGVTAALDVRPDVVFVDIGLPHTDGYEVARRLRAAGCRMRLVALTGYGRDADVQRAREAGFDQHLLKPATAEQLRSAIDAARREGPQSAATSSA